MAERDGHVPSRRHHVRAESNDESILNVRVIVGVIGRGVADVESHRLEHWKHFRARLQQPLVTYWDLSVKGQAITIRMRSGIYIENFGIHLVKGNSSLWPKHHLGNWSGQSYLLKKFNTAPLPIFQTKFSTTFLMIKTPLASFKASKQAWPKMKQKQSASTNIEDVN